MSKHERGAMVDQTFSDVSAYGSDLWVASTLGRKITWLRTNRDKLRAEGFPDRDPLTTLTIKADVLTWIEKRRRVLEIAKARQQSERLNSKRENYDAF